MSKTNLLAAGVFVAAVGAIAVGTPACSSGSGGGGSGSSSGGGSGSGSGGGSGSSSGSNCSCDVTDNGVSATIDCGASKCVNGTNYACDVSGGITQSPCSGGGSGSGSGGGGGGGSGSGSGSGGGSGSSSGGGEPADVTITATLTPADPTATDTNGQTATVLIETAPSYTESPQPSDQLDLFNVKPDSISPAPGACSNGNLSFDLNSDGTATLTATGVDTDPATDCAQWISTIHGGSVTLTYSAVPYSNGGSANVTVNLD